MKKELVKIFCELANAGEHNHAYLVINNKTRKVITGTKANNKHVDGALVTTPTHSLPYTANTTAAAEKWEKELHDFQLHTKVCRATIEFIQKMY